MADGLSKHLSGVVADTLAVLAVGDPPHDAQTAAVELDAGRVTIALRRRAGGPDGAGG